MSKIESFIATDPLVAPPEQLISFIMQHLMVKEGLEISKCYRGATLNTKNVDPMNKKQMRTDPE